MSPIVAFDFETTRIKAGTPAPLYLTAYTEKEFDNGVICCGTVSEPVRSMQHLRELLEEYFLVPYWSGARFVAWNANGFDNYFIAAALVTSPRWILRPYLTKNRALRGLRVVPSAGFDPDKKSDLSWEFLDGMAMTGLMHVPLSIFLKTFAPEHHKLEGVIDFSKEDFDAKNPAHVEYAVRDSVGLYQAMIKAEGLVLEHFNEKLAATIGNTGIKIMKAHIPEDVFIKELSFEVREIFKNYVMRGGYCHCVGKYYGPVWKYDINQAYAAAMREALLPSGLTARLSGIPKYSKVFIVRCFASNPNNKIPFYYKSVETGNTDFGVTYIGDTWVTSIEYNQLKQEGWNIVVYEVFAFTDSFSLKDYVDKLEHLRNSGPGGTKGAQGTMVKSIGNNSYGKTVETLDGTEILFHCKQIPGFSEMYIDDSELMDHAWFRITEAQQRDYHQPQIGSFITAHVRMVLRRVILTNPDHWLYADTDCAIFSTNTDQSIDLHPTRYGAWKKETDGEIYRIITKKVYANEDASEKHAKGVSVKKLTAQDFVNWYDGDAPVQIQIQRVNFAKVMSGENMYREREKRGTKKGVILK